ncbi:MAG: hypothetical protein ACRDQ4_18725 [Pseudonocardiaceae bacterium]
MHRQLRRAAIVSTSAAVFLGIAGIQAGIAQAAQPVSMSVAHVGLATPLVTSSSLWPAHHGNAGNDGQRAAGGNGGPGGNGGICDHGASCAGGNGGNGGDDNRKKIRRDDHGRKTIIGDHSRNENDNRSHNHGGIGNHSGNGSGNDNGTANGNANHDSAKHQHGKGSAHHRHGNR